MKHTPGPWMHKPRARDGHLDVITTKNGNEFIGVGSPIAETPVMDHPHENHQTANARLISKLPDMVALLERLGPWLDKFIADGAHEAAVMPRDFEQAYKQLNELMKELSK